ncbi:hypothetical protein UF00_040565, partial [Burkholderia cenocepacia]|nr:hypothetical protein [Burkholderia cenocepacia]
GPLAHPLFNRLIGVVVNAVRSIPFIILLVVVIPFIAGTIAMVLNGIHSDRSGERRMHCAMATLLAAVGLTLTGLWLHSAMLALVALTLASIGILAAFPVFWSLPSAFLAGTPAAGGIALINSIGNLAGFVAPYMIGWF